MATDTLAPWEADTSAQKAPWERNAVAPWEAKPEPVTPEIAVASSATDLLSRPSGTLPNLPVSSQPGRIAPDIAEDIHPDDMRTSEEKIRDAKEYAFAPIIGEIPHLEISPRLADGQTEPLLERAARIGVNSVGGALNFAQSRAGVGLAAVSAINPPVGAAIAAGFKAQGLKDLPQSVRDITTATTPEERNAAIESTIANVAMGAAPLHIPGDIGRITETARAQSPYTFQRGGEDLTAPTHYTSATGHPVTPGDVPVEATPQGVVYRIGDREAHAKNLALHELSKTSPMTAAELEKSLADVPNQTEPIGGETISTPSAQNAGQEAPPAVISAEPPLVEQLAPANAAALPTPSMASAVPEVAPAEVSLMPATDAAVKAVTPVLRPGQKQGDLLGGSEDLTLVGEKARSEPAKPVAPQPTIQQTVNEALDAYGDAASAHEHLGKQIEALKGDAKNKAVVERMKAAQRHIENALESEHRRSEQAANDEQMSERHHELVQSIKDMGGLPTLTQKGKYATGELGRIIESDKGAFLGLFRKGAKSLDTLRSNLEDRGFKFGTEYEMLSAIEDSIRSGKKKFGTVMPEDYRGGPGAMGPVEAAQMEAERKIFQSAHDPINERRVAEGRDELKSAERIPDPVAWDEAQAKMEADPRAASRLVDQLLDGTKTSVSHIEDLMLTHELIDLNAARDLAGERAADANLSNAERASHSAEWSALEKRIGETEQAARAAGTASGRALRIRRLQIADDYTAQGISRRARKDLGRELTQPEADAIAHQADEIAKAQESANATQLESDVAQEKADIEHTQEQQAKADSAPTYHPSILARAEILVKGIEAKAEELRKSFNLDEFFGSESGAVGGRGGPKGEGRKLGEQNRQRASAIKVLSYEIAAKVARFGVDRATALDTLITRYGEKVKPYFGKAWDAAQKIVNDEHRKVPAKVKEAVKEGAVSPEKTKGPSKPEDFHAKLKADAVAGEGLDHATVAKIVKAHADAGVRGTDALMKAAFDTIKEAMPDVTQRDVNRAYVEYGKKTFPSREEVATELRRVRQAVKIGEDIARLEKDNLRPEKQGYQRDKADIEIRDLTKRRNELLRHTDIPPDAASLASRDEAKQTALKNRIEEIDRELKTGEKVPKRTPAEDSAATEQLRAEKDAMQAKLHEIQEAAKERPTKEEAYNTTRLKSLTKREAELTERLRTGNFAPKPKPVPPKLRADVVAANAAVEKIKGKVDQAAFDAKQAARGAFEKASSWVSRFVRAGVLSHVSVLEHLAGAAIENKLTRPLNSATAQLLRFNKTLNAIRKKATYHGAWGGDMAEARGNITSLKAAWDKLKTGKSDLDWLHEKGKVYPKSIIDVVGNAHGAIKEPVRQGIYSRAMELGIKAAEEQGLDPARDPALLQSISKDAYDTANSEIFIGDNFLTKSMHRGVSGMLRGEKLDPGMAKFTADVLDILFPVVNVPINIAIRKFRLAAGLPESAIRLGRSAIKGELKNGAEKLSKRDAELITKTFAYGGVGLALGIYAWNHPQQFGGIYALGTQAPDKGKDGLKNGEINVGGHVLSHHITHGPLGGHLNMIADARRLYDAKIRNDPSSPWNAKGEAAFFAMFAAGKDLPMMSTVGRLTSPFKSGAQKAGELIKQMFVPGIVQDVAEHMDKDASGNPQKRQTKTFLSEPQSGIPVLRKKLPESSASHRK